jgi:hypothetical protein
MPKKRDETHHEFRARIAGLLREVIEEAEEKGEPDIAELLASLCSKWCALRCQLTDVGRAEAPSTRTLGAISFAPVIEPHFGKL